MNLWQTILTRIGLHKPKPALSQQEALEVRPLRNPSLKWKRNEEGNVVITLPRRRDWKGRLLGSFFAIPESRPVVLDEVGSFVWEHCDGDRSVNELVKALCEEYNLNPKEVRVSLMEYMRMLGKRAMIAVAVPEEIVEKLDEATRKELKIYPASASPPAEQDEDSPDSEEDE